VAGTGDGLHRLGGGSGLKTNFGGVAETGFESLPPPTN
jgi:hypothetical protein